MKLDERIERAVSGSPFGFWVVNSDMWDRDAIASLADCSPGKILCLRGEHFDSLRYFPPEVCETLGCVAGFISDEDHEP